MIHANDKNNTFPIAAATVMTLPLFAIAIILISTSLLTPGAASQTTTDAGNNNTITPSSPSGIKLSSQPIYQEDAHHLET